MEKEELDIHSEQLVEYHHEITYEEYLEKLATAQSQNQQVKFTKVVLKEETVNREGRIPPGVTILDKKLFYHSPLTSIEIPTTVTEIREECFNCCSLKE